MNTGASCAWRIGTDGASFRLDRSVLFRDAAGASLPDERQELIKVPQPKKAEVPGDEQFTNARPKLTSGVKPVAKTPLTLPSPPATRFCQAGQVLLPAGGEGNTGATQLRIGEVLRDLGRQLFVFS